MRDRAPLLRAGLLAAALPLLAACGGDGSGPDRLAADEVAGVYNLCVLRFTPSNSILPAADLMATVVDTTPPPGRPEATVSLANGAYDLVYTRFDTFLQQMRGSVSYGATTVTLNAPSSSVVVQELLLARPLTLAFEAGTSRTLSLQSSSYSVARNDYARAIGSNGEGLAQSITGTLSISFSTAPCG